VHTAQTLFRTALEEEEEKEAAHSPPVRPLLMRVIPMQTMHATNTALVAVAAAAVVVDSAPAALEPPPESARKMTERMYALTKLRAPQSRFIRD
jgi:hypothetical protein